MQDVSRYCAYLDVLHYFLVVSVVYLIYDQSPKVVKEYTRSSAHKCSIYVSTQQDIRKSPHTHSPCLPFP